MSKQTKSGVRKKSQAKIKLRPRTRVGEELRRLSRAIAYGAAGAWPADPEDVGPVKLDGYIKLSGQATTVSVDLGNLLKLVDGLPDDQKAKARRVVIAAQSAIANVLMAGRLRAQQAGNDAAEVVVRNGLIALMPHSERLAALAHDIEQPQASEQWSKPYGIPYWKQVLGDIADKTFQRWREDGKLISRDGPARGTYSLRLDSPALKAAQYRDTGG